MEPSPFVLSQVKLNHGYTLIELLTAIAVLGLLAMIALFAYQDYIIRSQVAEGPALVGSAELALTEWMGAHTSFPANGVPGNNTSLGLAQPASIGGSYVASVAVGDAGQIELTFGNKANTAIAGTAKKCTLTPITSSPGSIRWQVQSCGFPSRYLPQAWRN